MRKFDLKYANLQLLKAASVLLFVLCCQYSVAASILSQKQVTINVSNSNIKSVLLLIQNQTSINFIYDSEEIKSLGPITINRQNSSVENLLTTLFEGTQFKYELNGNDVVIKKMPLAQVVNQPKVITINGTVLGVDKKPVVGATILSTKNSKLGTITNSDGKFSLKDVAIGDILEVSCVGKKSEKVVVGENANINIVLKDDEFKVEDVVVTGIYTRKADSFTGSYSSFTKKELQAVGGNNILQSLRTLDPSFNIIESNTFGSDPNRLPDIEIRGKSSMLGTREELETDPNQPLFILDGMETTLQRIFNLDMNRISSVIILKDAASTAIYGSKAANGVVVVETVKPTAGQLRLGYNGVFSVSMPDLSSYNLMNSRERLEFDRLSGAYKGNTNIDELLKMHIYNQKLKDIESGVDTYWLAEPLRLGLNNRHSITVDGGEGDFAFSLGGGYNGVNGVMKQSNRDVLSGNIDLSYRASKLLFTNSFSIDHTQSDNPIVGFSKYANANPYYKKYNEEGAVDKWLEYNDLIKASNPLYNASLNSYAKNTETVLSNFFKVQYDIIKDLRITGKFGLTKVVNKGATFISPDDTRFDEKAKLEKGTYNGNFLNGLKYEGEFSLTYAKVLDEKHIINIVAGGNINSDDKITESYNALGFPSGNFTLPSFSNGYPEYGKPIYYESTNRSVSAFVNGGYSYDGRYLIDASYRLSGSSLFGATKRYANTWAVGLAWNLHNEKFIKEKSSVISTLKLRASVGNPGNQNFSNNLTRTTFGYNYSSFNYFGMSSQLETVGNPDLMWQTTLDKNIGFDLKMFGGRLSVIFDYYDKVTDPLLISVDYPSSVGTKKFTTNMGEQNTKGSSGSVRYNIIHRPSERIIWSLGATYRAEKSTIGGIGNKLDAQNSSGQKNRYLERYYDGSDPWSDLWAVISRGIDPSTGREIFLDVNGNETFDYSYESEKKVGNKRPKLEGTINTSVSYKGFTLTAYLRYKWGAQEFNQAVFDKVENIATGIITSNKDKRALYDRWQKPGDIALYRDIASSSSTPISSRFIQKSNVLSLESVNLTYEFPAELIKNWRISNLRASVYANEIARISTIKAERGTEYPFARTVNFSLSLNF